MAEQRDPLDHFLAYLDRLKEVMDGAERSALAYAETCVCGGSIRVGIHVPTAERRRMHGGFLAQHRDCPWKHPDRAEQFHDPAHPVCTEVAQEPHIAADGRGFE